MLVNNYIYIHYRSVLKQLFLPAPCLHQLLFVLAMAQLTARQIRLAGASDGSSHAREVRGGSVADSGGGSRNPDMGSARLALGAVTGRRESEFGRAGQAQSSGWQHDGPPQSARTRRLQEDDRRNDGRAQSARGRRLQEEDRRSERARSAHSAVDSNRTPVQNGQQSAQHTGPEQSPATNAWLLGKDLGIADAVIEAGLTALGVQQDIESEDLSTENLADIPADVFGEAVKKACITQEGQSTPLNAMQLGKLHKWHREAISFQTSQKQPQQRPSAQPARPPAEKRKLGDVFDQANAGSFELMAKEALKQRRTDYRLRRGGHPIDEERPTDDQLSALRALIDEDEAPAADFAIWGPHGARMQRDRKYRAQVWINGEFVTKQLSGPHNFPDWQSSWRIFKSGMLILEEASVCALDAYERGIKGMVEMWPHAWGIISVADSLCRTEKWQRLFDEYEETKPSHWDPVCPWDAIIFDSAFGTVQGPLAHWWKTRVEHPANLPESQAAGYLAATEGINLTMVPPSSARGKGAHGKGEEPWNKQRTPRAILAALPDRPSAPADTGSIDWKKRATETCWKFVAGTCTKGKVRCPFGRIHKAQVDSEKKNGKKGKGRGKGGKGEEAAAPAGAATPADPTSKRSLKKAAAAKKGKNPHR